MKVPVAVAIIKDVPTTHIHTIFHRAHAARERIPPKKSFTLGLDFTSEVGEEAQPGFIQLLYPDKVNVHGC